MPFFELEYPKTSEKMLAVISAWENSSDFKGMEIGRDYMNGENTTISLVRKMYFSDPRPALDKTGAQIMGADGNPKMLGGVFVDNPYVANNKIGYGVFADIVSQKVNTLLDETPKIETDKGVIIAPEFIRNLGYALKIAGNKASAQTYAYLYLQRDNKISVFKTENCIPYFSEYTGELVGLIRYWRITANNEKIMYVETYLPDGITTYRTTPQRPNELSVYKPTEGYKYSNLSDVMGTRKQAENMQYPVIMLANNENNKSDLKASVRAKIDAIDIAASGLMDNIEDFSDLFWVVKNNAGMDGEVFADFAANIKRTKKVVITGADSDVTTRQVEIPTEARMRFIEEMKKELVFETGILDSAALTGSSLTNVAIKAATLKLRQRVSEFEWQVYNLARKAVDIYQQYSGQTFGYDIEFSQLLIENEKEIIETANLCRTDISRESYLEQVQRAGVIRDVKTELRRIAAEDMPRYNLDPITEEPVVEEEA